MEAHAGKQAEEEDPLLISSNNQGGETPQAQQRGEDGGSFLTAEELQELRELEELETEIKDNGFNYIPILEEEIALEGLDGITLQALWVRLKDRPGFKLSITEESKSISFWNSLRFDVQGIDFYEIPVPRPDLILPQLYLDEKGTTVEPLSAPEDLYLYSPVDEVDARGSCLYFKERIDVTAIVKGMDYSEVASTFENRLVLVANQQKRYQALIPYHLVAADLNLNIIQYCILERIGRARYKGEYTRGKVSLSILKMDPKTLFYQRKDLLKKNIITKQAFSMKFNASNTPAPITILHLTRFYTKYETSAEKNLKIYINELKQCLPSYRKEASLAKHKYGKHFLHILMRDYTDLVEYKDVNVDEMYLDKALIPKQGNYLPKSVKVFQLIDPSVNIETYLAKRNGNLMDEDTKEQEMDDGSERNIIVHDEIRTQRTSLFKGWMYMILKGVNGFSQIQFADDHNLFNLDSRSALRIMTKYKLADCVLQDYAKTKIQRFIYYKCTKANKIVRQISAVAVGQSEGTLSSTYHRLSVRDLEEMEKSTNVVISIPTLGKHRHETAADFITDHNSAANRSFISEEVEQAEILSTENIFGLGSTHTGASAIDDVDKLSSTATAGEIPETQDQQQPKPKATTSKRFAKALKKTTDRELNTFIPIKCNYNEDNWTIPFNFETSMGWHVLVEPAEINPEVIQTSNFLGSLRNLERANYIQRLIADAKLLIGFQRVINGIRRYEYAITSTSNAHTPGVDKRSLFRIIRELHEQKKILIWRLTLTPDIYKPPRIYTGFTLFDVAIDSSIIIEGVEAHIQYLCPPRHSRKDWYIRDKLNRFVEPSTKKRRQRTNARKKKLKKKPIWTASQGQAIVFVSNGSAIRKLKRATSKANASTSVKKFPSLLHTANKERRVYDEVDIIALKSMNRQRALWTTMEDNYIIYLFISTILFVPGYKIRRLIMHNSSQIRDIMHLKLVEARTKTAVAIRRRFHYLLRKSESTAKFRQCLAAANNDKELKLYIKEKCPVKAETLVGIYENLNTEDLIQVFGYLFEKFENGEVKETNPIRRYIEANNKKRKAAGDNEEELQPGTSSGIMSQAAGRAGGAVKRGRYQFINQAQEFEEEDAHEVGEGEADSGIILWGGSGSGNAYRRSYRPLSVIGAIRSNTSNILDCNSIGITCLYDIQLSVAKSMLVSLLFSSNAQDLVQRFVQRIDGSVLKDILDFLKTRGIATVPKGKRFTLSVPMKRRLQNHLTPAMYNTCNNVWEMAELNGFFNCSRITTLAALYLLSELSAYALLSDVKTNIDITLPTNAVDFTTEWKEILTKSNSQPRATSFMVPSALRCGNVNAVANANAPLSQSQQPSELQDFNLTVFRAPKLPYEKKYAAKKARVHEEEPGGQSKQQEEESQSTTQFERLAFTRANSVTLREYKSHIATKITNEEEIYKPVDANIFNLTLPNINFHFPIKFQNIFESNLGSIDDVIQNVERSVKITVTPNFERAKCDVPHEFMNILRLIWITKERGVTFITLQKSFENTLLRDALNFFLENELVYIVGTDFRRVVGFPFIQDWTVPVPIQVGTLVAQRVIMRPWISCAGALNWPLIVQLFSSLIGYLEQNPGSHFIKLASSLIPVVNPVDVSLLLQILLQFNIVQVFKLCRPPELEQRPTLFSEEAIFSQDYAVDPFLQLEELNVELGTFYVLKYSTFQRLLKPKLDEASKAVFCKGANLDAIITRKRKRRNNNNKRLREPEEEQEPTEITVTATEESAIKD